MGQLGGGADATRLSPGSPIAGSWQTISAGSDHTCAIDIGGGLYCWGIGEDGALGNSQIAEATVPTAVFLPDRWTAVSAGSAHTCGLRQGGELWCWGLNGDAQLGRMPPPGNEFSPIRVDRGASIFVHLSAGSTHSCAVREVGALDCFGEFTGRWSGP